MNCEDARQLLPEYWSRTIRMNDHALLERHLAECPECRRESEYLSSVWERLDLIPVEAPGPRLRARFYESLEAYRRGHEESAKTVSIKTIVSRKFQRPAMWQFAAAAAALFAGGLFLGRSLDIRKEAGDKVTSNQQIGQLRTEVDHMRQLVALSLLQQQSATDRLQGVNWAYRVEKSDTEVVTALLNAVRADPSVNVRLAAVDALRPFGSSSPLVRKAIGQSLLKQDSPMVQIALIDLLVDLRDHASSAPIRTLSEDPKMRTEVRERAREAATEFK
jgi:HEAT repeats/Putative zinc-finger